MSSVTAQSESWRLMFDDQQICIRIVPIPFRMHLLNLH